MCHTCSCGIVQLSAGLCSSNGMPLQQYSRIWPPLSRMCGSSHPVGILLASSGASLCTWARSPRIIELGTHKHKWAQAHSGTLEQAHSGTRAG
eukprot:10023586-Alexandrium_andersonii.AAC.1